MIQIIFSSFLITIYNNITHITALQYIKYNIIIKVVPLVHLQKSSRTQSVQCKLQYATFCDLLYYINILIFNTKLKKLNKIPNATAAVQWVEYISLNPYLPDCIFSFITLFSLQSSFSHCSNCFLISSTSSVSFLLQSLLGIVGTLITTKIISFFMYWFS